MPINTNRLNIFRYSIYAPTYSWSAKVLNGSRRRSLALLNVKPEEKVLIIGAGTGLDLDYLPLGCHITATDITPAMVRRIKKRNLKRNHQLTCTVMDGQNLSYPDQTFDKVILHLILTVIPDPSKTLQEAERVLKHGGQAVVFDKFIPNGKRASFTRQFFNLFTHLMFSSLILSFDKILAHTQLNIVHDIKVNLKSYFRIILLEK